jgi:hypothetical protein
MISRIEHCIAHRSAQQFQCAERRWVCEAEGVVMKGKAGMSKIVQRFSPTLY